jgi:hypothetical protein
VLVQSIPRPLPDTTRRLQEANKAFRDAVASEMQVAARQAGVKIRTDNFVAILLDDGSSVVVNAVISGVENLTLEQLAKGADVLFTFLRVPQGSALPSGFYTVRIFQPGGTQVWKVQFKNLQGQVALETDAEVGPGEASKVREIIFGNRYTLLKEMVKMGIIRLVVDYGEIEISFKVDLR